MRTKKDNNKMAKMLVRPTVNSLTYGLDNAIGKSSESDAKNVAEYFAGIGLVRMGLETQGWRVVFANDISPKKHEMYGDFFHDADDHYVVGDVFDLDPFSIPRTDLATCSFPCIDLSLAGNMNGINGAHSSAFWGFVRILREQGRRAPPLVLVENVPGWLHSNGGADFRLTIKSLNEIGYVCDVFTLDALRFVPQSRLRVFLIGVKAEVLDDNPSTMLIRPPSLTSHSLRRSVLANRDLDWFAAPIPDPPPLLKAGLSRVIEVLDDGDSRWWSDEEVARHLEMMDDAHRTRVNELMAGNEVVYRTFFRRRRKGRQRAEVRHDDIAGCLRTAVGGSGKQFLLAAGNGQVKMRVMTPREYARLQGVPENYRSEACGVQALTGFGDAVCVPLISWIGRNVLNPLMNGYLSKTLARLNSDV